MGRGSAGRQRVTQLERLSQAERMLAEVATAQEARDVMKMADLAAEMARRVELGTASVNHALLIKAKAMRRLADVVDEGQANGEIKTAGQPSIVRSADNTPAPLPIPRQRLAEARQIRDAFPTDGDLEEVFSEATEKGREMPTRSLVREAASRRQPEPVIEEVPLPDGVFPCIVIDPPWPMQKIERDERPHQGAALDYPVMSLDEIAKLPIGELAADDAHLYLWVTHKFLPAGLELLETWGFRYQCVMTWRKNVGITPFSWMYDTEHVLFARRGSLDLTRLGLRLSFDAPVTGHSVKPGVFYERVVAASPGPRLEMFARRDRDGFTTWGNEVANDAAR